MVDEMTFLLRQIKAYDRHQLFTNPTDVPQVPDYFESKATTMDFKTMEKVILNKDIRNYIKIG